MDYYDYGPRVQLQRPIALIGFMGAGVRQVAHDVSARLGLPMLDLDRMVEHHAGQSLTALQIQRGEVVRRAFEKRALSQAVRGTPPGVVALGDATLIDTANRTLVGERCTLVYIERPMAEQRARLARALQHEPGLFPEFAVAGLPDEEAPLRSMWARRQPGYDTAAHRIEAGTLHATQVTGLLLESLGLHTGDPPPTVR